MKKYNGFTLIELMITCLVMAILAAVAVSSYSSYARKGRRADALNALYAMSMAEERYRSNNTTYGTLAQVYAGVSTSPEGYYTLSISNVSGSAYTLTATATGNQTRDVEGSTSCTPLTLTVSAGTTTKSPAACWPS